MKQIPLMIFDMDGLMLDTERIGWLAWQELLEPFGVAMDFAAYTKVIGTNQRFVRETALEAWGSAFPIDRFLDTVWARRMEMARDLGVPKKAGLVELLEFLREQGVPCAVATSSDRKSMEELLQTAGVFHYFAYTACGNEVTHSKPHPEIFLRAAEKAGVSPGGAFVLEDSANGIRAAHAAGMRGLFVKDLIDLPEDAVGMAHRRFQSLTEVRDWLREG